MEEEKQPETLEHRVRRLEAVVDVLWRALHVQVEGGSLYDTATATAIGDAVRIKDDQETLIGEWRRR